MKEPLRPGPTAAFSRTEAIAVVVLVTIIGLLAWPTISNALANRELTRTMNNGRELYLAAFQMAADGAVKTDTPQAWPGDYQATSLAEYCGRLVQHGYLTPADLQRIFSAPGAACTATMSGPPATLMLSGKSALKVYKVKRADPSNTIFAASVNYTYDTPLDPNSTPFGDSGFVVVRKSGDADFRKKRQATPAGYDNSAEKFQTEVGSLPGATNGVVTPGDGETVLTSPQ